MTRTSHDPSPGQPCRGCGELTLCEIVPHPTKAHIKLPLCPECVALCGEEPEKRALLLADLDDYLFWIPLLTFPLLTSSSGS